MRHIKLWINLELNLEGRFLRFGQLEKNVKQKKLPALNLRNIDACFKGGTFPKSSCVVQ